MAKIKFVIDTNKYAGNFERELCAFITGQIGECGVGDDVAERETPNIRNLEWFENHIVDLPDEHGCRRPVEIDITPGWYNNGHGGLYRNGTNEEEAKEAMIASTIQFHASRLEMAKKRIADNDFEDNDRGWTEEACRREVSRIEEEYESVKTRPLRKYPAYMSVAIHLDDRPEGDVLAEMKERALAFNKNTQGERGTGLNSVPDDFEITGFRLVFEKTSASEESV